MGKATPLLGLPAVHVLRQAGGDKRRPSSPAPSLLAFAALAVLWTLGRECVYARGGSTCGTTLPLRPVTFVASKRRATRSCCAVPPEPRREALPGGTRESPAAREGGRRSADSARAPGGGARCARRAGRGDVVGAGRAGAVALVAAAAAAVIVAAAGCPGGSSSNGSGSGGPEESEAAPSAAARGSGGTSSCPAVAGAEAFAVSYRARRSRPWLGRAECPWGGAEP